MELKNKIRVLWVCSGPAMLDDSDSNFLKKYRVLSKYFYGDIITPVMDKKFLNIKNAGDFIINSFHYYFGNGIIKNVVHFFYVFRSMMRVLGRGGQKIDIIVAPDPLFSGLLALILNLFIKAKVIIEINGCFESAFDYETVGQSSATRWKKIVIRHFIRFTTQRSDLVKLLFPAQIDSIFKNKKRNFSTAVFHDYVPVSEITEHPVSDSKYILLMGFPWYLKGVDLLINAFKTIAAKHSEYTLKIVGYCPTGREYFEKLAYGHDKIELHHAVGKSEALKLISECSLFVLASRTEAMGRVLLESMACRKPVIGSNIDGIPIVIKDNYNGLLFKSGDEKDLAEKLDRILSDAELRKRLAENGYTHVTTVLSDDRYIENYKEMVQSLLSGQNPA